MFHKDWSPRPIAGVWKDLVLKQWWTDERQITDDSGVVQIRGFLGNYDITATAGGRSATIKTVLANGAHR